MSTATPELEVADAYKLIKSTSVIEKFCVFSSTEVEIFQLQINRILLTENHSFVL